MSKDDKIIPMYEGDDSHDDDPRPLPLIVAETWNFPLQHYDTDDGVLYAIQDWIAGIASAGTRKAGEMWRKQKEELRISITHLKYRATDGKEYDRAFTADEGLYTIAAYMRATKTRHALKSIKEYLAKAGAFADLARREPESVEARLSAQRKKKWLREGKEDEWMAIRNIGVVTRKKLMEVVKHLLGLSSSDAIYGVITNDTYRGLFGMSAVEIRNHMGLPTGANVREFMRVLGLIFTAQAEEMCRLELEDYGDDDIVAPEDVRRVIITLSRFVGKQVREASKRLGRDILTERKLLSYGDDDSTA